MDTTTLSYKLLELIALSGECCPSTVSQIGISSSYGQKLITRLKEENYIKTHYKDRLRGLRLTNKGKKLLLHENPKRFHFYLSGNSDTNRPRSDLPRRIRLQQASIVYALLMNSGVTLFRDHKPLLFNTLSYQTFSLPMPVFYHSREIKELGAETIKINNSRMMGILLTPNCIYIVFYTGDALMKWEYRTEIKVKAMITYHISRGILSKDQISPSYHPDTPIKALIIGSTMDISLKILTSTGGVRKSNLYLDTSFHFFHFIPNSTQGETILKILCSPFLFEELKSLLLSDLQSPNETYGLEHDAVSDGTPVLLAYDYDMLRIARFHTALSFHAVTGCLICFDFQKEALAQYFLSTATIKTIDLDKFERRFLH